MRTPTLQEINLNTQANLTTLTEPELVELLIKAERSPDTFSAIERRQYLTWVFLRLRLDDMAYFQYERGVIDEERLRSAIGPLRGTMRSRAAREQWQNGKGNFVQSFQDFMDEYISEIPMVE